MNDILQTLAVLVTALLWGGVVVVDFVVTPARFRTPNVERSAINAIGGEIFSFWGYVQVPLQVVLILLVIIGGGEINAILPPIFLLVLTGLQVGLLEPTMKKVRQTATPEDIAAGKGAHQQLHQAYAAADIFKAILGAVLLAVLVAA